jgi:vacuolar-type H+-ATPase subunit D/Vma8
MDSLTSKPSCINDLKELVNNLTDRDVDIKNHLKSIKSVLEDKRIKCDTVKIKKIKQILKNG